MKLSVPETAKVFVLDDTQERLDWFRGRFAQMRFAKTAKAALEILGSETFDVIFLDHDLSFMDAGFPDRQFDNGKEVARFIAIRKVTGQIIIHSHSEQGVLAMKNILPQATVCRFDELDSALTISQAVSQQ